MSDSGPAEPSHDQAGKEPEHWKLPKSDVFFAFGPEKWYFVRCGEKWRFVRSNRSDWETFDVKDIHYAAFKHNTGVFLGGQRQPGEARITHTWNESYMVPYSEVDSFIESREAYAKLHAWLTETTNSDVDKVKEVFITIGPKGSYFARCGSSWTSHGLPTDLFSMLEEEKDKKIPAAVALGIGESWIALWADGTRSWDLKNKYPGIVKSGILPMESSSSPIVFVALNPYQENRYFLGTADGAVGYSTTLSSPQESEALNELTNEYMRSRAKRDGTSFGGSYSQDGVSRSTMIAKDDYVVNGNRLTQSWKERRDVLLRKDNLAMIGALTGGAAVISKLSGATTARALLIASSVGLGSTLQTLHRG